MRRLALGIFFLFSTVSFAGEYTIKWKVSGHNSKAEFDTKISTSSNQQIITHHFPQGFSFCQIMMGSQQSQHDSMFISAATPNTDITIISGNTVQIENNGVSQQTESLLSLMYSALQSTSDSFIPVPGHVSLGISPIPLLPGSNDYLGQTTSNGITVSGDVVHTNLHISYGADYGVILEQVSGGFNLILTHSVIEAHNVQEIVGQIHEDDSSNEEANFSVFIPTETMLALTGSSAGNQVNLAEIAATGAALLIAGATSKQ